MKTRYFSKVIQDLKDKCDTLEEEVQFRTEGEEFWQSESNSLLVQMRKLLSGDGIEKGGSVVEVIFILVMLSMWIVPFAVFELWWWMWMFIAIGIVFAIFELTSKLKTGKTLSVQFWRWSVVKNEKGQYVNRWKAWTILACMLTGWVMLLVHLAWKMLFVG